MHPIAPVCMLNCSFMPLYTRIYAYIGVFWLTFGLILYHCSPWQEELPMTPRELCKTAKCKHNIGQTLQHLVLALNLILLDNRAGRRECKAAIKKSNDHANMLEKFYFPLGHNCTCFNLNE